MYNDIDRLTERIDSVEHDIQNLINKVNCLGDNSPYFLIGIRNDGRFENIKAFPDPKTMRGYIDAQKLKVPIKGRLFKRGTILSQYSRLVNLHYYVPDELLDASFFGR